MKNAFNRVILLVICLSTFQTSCKKDSFNQIEGNERHRNQALSSSSSSSSGVFLSETEINDNLRATAMGVAYLAYSNQNFVRLTRELIALEFDGDFNALIPQISSEYTSRNYGNLNSELISASPEAINPNFLSSFFLPMMREVFIHSIVKCIAQMRSIGLMKSF